MERLEVYTCIHLAMELLMLVQDFLDSRIRKAETQNLRELLGQGARRVVSQSSASVRSGARRGAARALIKASPPRCA